MTAGFPADWKPVDHLRHALDQALELVAGAGGLVPPAVADHITTARALVDDQEQELELVTRLLIDAQEKEDA